MNVHRTINHKTYKPINHVEILQLMNVNLEKNVFSNILSSKKDNVSVMNAEKYSLRELKGCTIEKICTALKCVKTSWKINAISQVKHVGGRTPIC